MKTTYSLIASICTLLITYLTLGSAGAQDSKQIEEVIRNLDSCLAQGVYSFVYPKSRPPTTTDGLDKSCKSQAEGLRCMKNKIKRAPPLVKRGLTALIQTRQRYNKKYCTNVNSEPSKQFVKDMKCIMEKRLDQFLEVDSVFANTLLEIKRRDYTDSSIELRYLCCSFVAYRRGIVDAVGKECASSRAMVEEMILSIVSNDINLICDEEDKLITKVCPKIEPYKNISRTFDVEKNIGPAGSIVYIVATLGEAETANLTTVNP